jgi:hypothetical protein
MVGQTLSFDGGSGHLRVADHPSLRLTNSLTVEGWIYPINISGYHCIVSKWDAVPGPDQRSYSIGLHPDGRAYLVVSPSGTDFGAGVVFSSSPVPSNQWTHLAVTYDGNALRIFTNGVPSNKTDYSQGIFAGISDLGIGANVGGTVVGDVNSPFSAPFSGLIDDLSLYRRALEPNEIAAIYAAGSAGKCGGTNPPPVFVGVPSIFDFAPKVAHPGSPVIISGTNFSSIPSNNIVYFGATRALVMGASGNQLDVIVPAGATHEPVTVTVNGLTAFAPAAFLPSFPGAGTNISVASFAPGQNLSVGDGPLKTIIADLDGDGKPDLIEANAYAHNISIFRNIAAPGTLNGSSFAPRVDFPVLGGTDSPRCIAVADVDGDGKLDILVGDQASSSVLVYRNLATPGELTVGSFAAPVSFAAGSYPHGLRVADLNGDGLPEILVANYSGNSISILQNQGSAGSLTTNSFAPQFVLATGPNPTDIAVADFNGDGRPDLVTTAFGGTQLSVFRNVAGAGTAVSNWFTLDTTLPALPGSLEFAVADMDGDAKSDLIVASVHGNAVSVYRNLADAGAFHAGSFAARVDFGTPGWAHNVNVADFNGDGKSDLAVTGELSSYMAVFQNQSTPGSFTASSLAARVDYATGWNAWGVAAGDLDGDDRADIVFANTYDDTLTFYRNQMAFGQTNPPISCVNPPSGLVSWWKAENDAMDLINGHNGTLQNGVTFTPGEVGQGFGFNGTDSYVNIPSSAALKPTGAFAFEAWIKYSGNPGAVSSYCIAAKGIDAEAAMDWALTVSANNRLRPHINVNGSWHYFDCDTSLSAGTWYHVAMIYDGEHLQGYVNGALDGSANVTGSVQTSDAPLRLGAYAPVNGTGSKAFFTGSIDEASFYNRNLSAGELFAIFNAGSAGKCSPTNSTFNPADGLIAHYPFSGNAADVSGNGNHGTPSNAVLAADRFGSPNAAYSFNGQNAAVLVADNPALRSLTSNYTFNAWVRFGSNPQIDAAILMKSAGAGDQRKWTFWRHVQAPPYGIGLLLNRVPGGQFQWNSDSSFTTSQWYMVTFSASATHCLIAVDGQVVSTQSGNAGLPDTTGLTMSIGGAEPAGNQWFNGLLDDIRIYNRTFTSNDIAQLYELESEQPAEVAAIPVIFSFQPAAAHPGSLVSISGTNFSSIASNNIVYFGAMRALVVGGTTTNLQVIVPSGATYAPPTVTANGLTAAAQAAFTPTFAGAGNIAVTNFAPRFKLPAGDGPIQTVIADLDGDGKPDLAVADNYAHAVSLYRNISQVGTLDANSFAARVVLPANPAGYSPYALVAADVDGDGWLDLVTADVEGNSVSVFRNQATLGVLDTNSFAAYVTFAVGAGPRTVAVADLDLDGRPEIVTANYGNSTISILRNTSVPGQINASSFAARLDYPAGAGTFGVVAADLDGDGRPDIATANNQGASVSLFRNVGMGPLAVSSFVPTATLSVPAHAHFLYAADFDADGRLELVVNSYLGASMTVLRNQADPGVLDTNSFAAGITYGLSGRGHTAAFGDLNGDGKFDLIVDTEIADSIALFQNQHGDGAFTNDSLAARVDLVAGWNAWGNSVGDLDGDGRPDIVFANAYDDIISIYHNRSSISTNPPVVCVPPPVGLMGWWRAEGNTSDSFGTNTGTLLGGAGFAAGLVGQAFIFDGVDDSVRIPVSGPFTLPDVGIGEGFTVEAWINPNRLTIGPIFEWNNNAGGEGVHLWHSVDSITAGDGPGNLYGNIVDITGVSHRITSPSGLLQTNQFNHVALSYDRAAGVAVIYHNGVAVKSEILGTFTPRTSYDLHLGRRPSGFFSENLFAGLIDEPSIYNRALADNEIAAIYAAGSAGKCYTNPPPPPEPPFITQQPQSIATNANANVRFSVAATGSPMPAYQWYFNNAPLGGQVNASLVLANVTPNHAGDYFVIANNASGSVTSSVASLTVLTYPPAITNQPKSIAAVIGGSASFSVGASGSAPLSYQWFFTGQPLPGRTQATLTLTNLQPSNAGNYFVRVSNPYGVTTSAVATLTVSPPPDCAPAPSGIVAWWPGQSNLWDVVGVSDAILYQFQMPASLLYTNGKVGAAISFLSGGSKWIVAPPRPELNVGIGAGFTFEAWVYRTPTGNGPIFAWGGFFPGQTNALPGVRLQMLSNGRLDATLVQTNGLITMLSTLPQNVSVLGSNTWNHVAVTCDNTTRSATLYVNGAVVAQTLLPGQSAPIALRTAGVFGLGYASQQQLLGAILDEPTLYNRALSQAEIQSIHDAQQTGKCPPASPCLNPLVDLAGWWRGESNTLDSASINHGMMPTAAAPPTFYYATGQFGAAFSLRSGNYVVISNPPTLNVGAGAGLTIEAWINPFTTSLPIVEWNSGTGTQGVYLAYSYSRGPGYLEANLVDTQGQSHVIQSPFISPVYNQWRHVAVTYDQASGAAALFVDGAVVTQTNLGSFTPRTTGNLYLGYRPPGNYPGSGLRFNGLMDEVAVYRRALTPAELRCAMRGGPNGKFPPANECLLPADGIVSWWRGESNQLDSIQSNHGLAGITAPFYTNGQVGLAFATGLRRYVQVPMPVGLDVGTGAGLTVEGWIKTTSAFGQGPESIFGWRGNQFQGQGVTLEYGAAGPGSLRANLVTTNGLARYLVAPNGVIKTSQWQHVALTYDRASGWATLLVDGNTVAATNFGSFTPRTAGSFNLGWGGNFSYFTGAMDEFAVYNRALSPLEIGAIARAVNGRCFGQPPVIVQHPESLRVNPGSNVTFTVGAEGSAPLRYQWGKGTYFPVQNLILPGQTNSVLSLPNVSAADAGMYWVRVTNQYGSAVSTNIQLVVNSAPRARIVLAPLTTLLHETNLVIAPVCGVAVVYFDGGQSSDADNDPLQFTWRLGTNVLGQTVLLTNTFAPGNYEIELEVSDGSLSGFAQTTLRVISPAEAVQIIAAAVSAADATADKRGNSLFASLRAASAAFDRCQLVTGLNQLHAFQEHVRAQVAPSDPERATAWIAAAQQLIDGVSGPAPGRSAPKFQELTRTSLGKMKLRFRAESSQPAWVQASTNLIHWETIGLAETQSDGTASFEDPQAGEHARRFYRIVTP